MAAVIPVAMMAGAAISAMGAIGQANAAKAASSYNAQLKEREAIVAVEQSEMDALRVRRQGEQAQGSLLAGYGAAGVVSDEGSPMDVLQMSAANAKLDEETVRYKGRLKATGYINDAALDRQQGRVAEQQGALNASSYLLTGAGKTASAFYSSRMPLSRVGDVA